MKKDKAFNIFVTLVFIVAIVVSNIILLSSYTLTTSSESCRIADWKDIVGGYQGNVGDKICRVKDHISMAYQDSFYLTFTIVAIALELLLVILFVINNIKEIRKEIFYVELILLGFTFVATCAALDFLYGILLIIVFVIAIIISFFISLLFTNKSTSEDETNKNIIKNIIKDTNDKDVNLSIKDGVINRLGSSYHDVRLINISTGAKEIDSFTFNELRFLESVTIGNCVTNIGYCAFRKCSSLKNLTIGDSETIEGSGTSIGESAFDDCSSLKNLTIGNNVTSIGEWAFSNCSSLETVIIPVSVTSIGEWAFSNCSSLKSVTIGNNVTSIGDYAFSGCSSLETVIIPVSVTSIGKSAFFGCESLKTIYYAGTKKQWNNIAKDKYDFILDKVKKVFDYVEEE